MSYFLRLNCSQVVDCKDSNFYVHWGYYFVMDVELVVGAYNKDKANDENMGFNKDFKHFSLYYLFIIS